MVRLSKPIRPECGPFKVSAVKEDRTEIGDEYGNGVEGVDDGERA
jgi:hypothetical protein